MRTTKRWFSKIGLSAFYLLIISFNQCCYAGIEKYLITDEQNRQILNIDGYESKPDMREVEEISKFLSENKVFCIDIQVFDFSSGIGEKISSVLLNALQKNQALTQLDLGDNQIGDAGAQALASALQVNHTLTQLNLWGNNIGDTGAQALASALQVNHTLTQLGLGDNQIGEVGAQALASALQVNQRLTQLNLWGNNIGDAGAQALASALQVNHTLTQLDLGDNQIGEAGAQALASALQVNQRLTQLNLWGNNIGDVGAQALVSALQVNHTLTQLDLENNEIGAAGAQALVSALQVNHTLTQLNLLHNNISAAGTQAIINALVKNIELQDMQGLELDSTQGAMLSDILARNKLLAKLSKIVLISRLNATLLGTHHRVGDGSPLNMLDAHTLREIVTLIKKEEPRYVINEAEFNRILHGTEDELTEFKQEEYELINRIRTLQNEIMEKMQTADQYWQPLRMLVFRVIAPVPMVAAAAAVPQQIVTEQQLANATAEKPEVTVVEERPRKRARRAKDIQSAAAATADATAMDAQ